MTKKGKKKVTFKFLAKQEITPYPPEDIARLNALLEPKPWEDRQRRWRQELALTFGFLRMSKAELMKAADDPETVNAFKAYCEAVRETSESLKAAAEFMESAETRIMISMAATFRSA